MVTRDEDGSNIPNPQTVIVDRRAEMKLRKAEANAAAAKYKAVVEREREAAKSVQLLRREEIKLELAKMRLKQSASEKARGVIASASPWMVCFICGGFVFALSTGNIPAEATATSSALITLVMTGLLANLRSIISEGNVADESNGNGHETKPEPKPKP